MPKSTSSILSAPILARSSKNANSEGEKPRRWKLRHQFPGFISYFIFLMKLQMHSKETSKEEADKDDKKKSREEVSLNPQKKRIEQLRHRKELDEAMKEKL